MTMTIGETTITADIQKRKKAEKTFEAAKKAGKSASLLKQQRPNIFSMNVANIMPGDEIDIELHYSEFLVPTDGTYEFVFPTVVGPRYSEITESEASVDDQWIKSPYLPAGEKPTMQFHLAVEIATGIPLKDIRCPTHAVDIAWQNSAEARAVLSPSEIHGGDRDFILQYRLSGDQIESGLLLYEGEDENFFALMVQPPERVTQKNVPDREYIFVVDVSGSMNGFPLNTAKRLINDLIGSLRAADSFNAAFRIMRKTGYLTAFSL